MFKINQQEFDDHVVVIGNKIKECPQCKQIPYLKPIIKRLAKYEYVLVNTFPDPEKLAIVEELFEIIKWFGIREVDARRDIISKNPKNPNEVRKIRIIKWEVIPRLKAYRQELDMEIKTN